MSYLCYFCLFGSSLPPVVCRRSHVLFMLFVFVWFIFTSSCLQEVSCLIYVISVCLVRLYLQLFVGGFMSYLRYLCLFGSSLPLFVCRRSHILFMLFVFVWFIFISSCLQEVSCLIYVICVCLVRLYLQLFVGGLISYLCYLCLFGSSLPPVVCRRSHILFMLFVFVWFIFISRCLQEGSYLIYVICVCLVHLYLQLFAGGLMSYLCYLCLFGSSLPPVVCRRSHALLMLFVFVWFFFTSSCLQEVSYLIYVICVCLVHLYLQLFVGGLISYLCYLCLFGSSLPPVVCRRSHVLFMLFLLVWFVFTSSCLQEVSCLIYVICVCLVHLYLQLFVGGLMSYLCYFCLFGSSLPPVICRRFHVLFTLFVFVWFIFTSICLQEVSYLIYVICVCLVHLYLQLFAGGLMSYLCYLCLFGSSLSLVVCRRSHILFMLFVFVWFVFTSSCLQEVSYLIYVICVCLVHLYLQVFVGGLISYLRYLCLFGSSLPPVVCRRSHVLFMLFVFVWFVFTSSCFQEVSCLTNVICVCLVLLYLQLFVGGLISYLCYLCLFGSSLSLVVCRRAHILFMLFVFVWFIFTSSCLQEVSCLIYVFSACLVRLYLQLFVGGLMSYLCYLCLFGSSLPPVVCRRSHVLFMLFLFVWFVFTSSCLQEVSCFIYVICVCLVHLYLQLFVGGLISYLCYLCLFGSSLPLVVWRSHIFFMLFCLFGSSLPLVVCMSSHILFMLFVFVWFVFTSSCLQEVSYLIYVICVCLVHLYLQLFAGGLMSYLCYLCLFGSSLPPVVCKRSHILFMLFVFVWFVFASSCLQEVSYLCNVICVCLVRLYLQLFGGGLMFYLCYLCLFGASLPPVVCRRYHILFMLFVFGWFIFTSRFLQEVSYLIYVICVCLVHLYLQLFVGGLISYLCYLCLFGSSLPPVVCRRSCVLFMLFVFVWFIFISSCLQEGSYLIYAICVCLVHLYLQLFAGGLMFYLCYLCLFGSSLPPVVCRRSHILFMLFVFVWFIFISSCLQEVSYLIYVICVCLVRLYLQLFVGGLMSYLCYLCLFGSSLPPVVCRRSHILFMLFVFVWFIFTSSCLQEFSYLIYVICVCLVRLYLQLFVGGLISYLCYLCLFGSSLPLVVWRSHILFMLFVFVWFISTSSCLQEFSYLIYVICVCLVRLYLQLFVGGLISYLCYLCLFGSSLPPVGCRRSHVLFMLFVFVWFIFISSCLQEVSCLIYVICVCLVHLYLQLFVGGLISYLRYLCLFGSSLPPFVCRRSHVLFMLFVFVWFVVTSSCLQEVSYLIYVICVCLVHLYLQLFVGGLMSYFMLFVFVWFVFTSSCLQEVSCLIYVICVCLVRRYLQLFAGGLISYLCYLCLFGSSLPPVVCRRSHVLFMLFVFVWFVFTSNCLQEVSYLIYVICVCLVHLYIQLFVGGLISYLCYLCLFGSSLSPVVCRRSHVLFMVFVFVWFVFTSSCLQEVSYLIYVICVCFVHFYLQLFVGVLISYLFYLYLFGSSLPPVVCRRSHILFTLFVFVCFIFTSSCLQEVSCLIYVICVCLVRFYLQLFVGGLICYLCYLCLFGSSLPPVVCRRSHILFMLFVFVWFIFTSSCLQEVSYLIYVILFVWFISTSSCLQEFSYPIYVICVCLVRLYLQLFVGGLISYLCYLCLFGSSLPPGVCRRSHVLFMLFVFVWFVFISSCLQEVSYLIYVICVCLVHLYLQLFVGGLMSYFMLFVFVWFVFTSSCLQEVSCLIYVICVCLVRLYLQLFVGGLISYLRYFCLFGSSLPPVVCRRSHVLFMLFVFVWFVFTSSCLQEVSYLIYVICVCLVHLYLQLFVGSLISYLCYLCLFCSYLSPVVCRKSHILFMLFVFVWFIFTSSCLQEVSYLIYVICICLVHLYLQLFVGGLMSYFMLFVFVWFVFTSSCLQEVSCLIYVICVCLVRLYLQLFVGGLISYLRYLCLFGSSLPPVVCRKSHILFMLFVFVWFIFTSSCLQEVSYLI